MHYPKTEMCLFFESIIERTLCESTENCRDFKEALQALSLGAQNCG